MPELLLTDDGDTVVNQLSVCVCVCVCTQSLSCVQLFATIAHQAPLSVGVSRQEYCSGLLFPLPGHLPDLGIKHSSPVGPALAAAAAAKSFQSCPTLCDPIDGSPPSSPLQFFTTSTTWEAPVNGRKEAIQPLLLLEELHVLPWPRSGGLPPTPYLSPP